MKKFFLLFALLSLACLTSQTALAKVNMGEARASRRESVNVIQWRTIFELDDLGFNIFREQNGKLTRLNPGLLPGSVLKVGDGRAMIEGNPYVWTDAEGTPDASYYLEAIALNGERTVFGPITLARSVTGANTSKGLALTLDQADLSAQSDSTGYSMQQGWPASSSKGVWNALNSSPASLQTQQTIAGMPAVKFMVKRAGWYRITQPQLLAAGLSPAANSVNLHLYVSGVEIPMRVNSAPGPLGAGDSIEFYGMGLDTFTTDTQVYWLVADNQPGLRIPVNAGQASPPATSAQSFSFNVLRKDRTIYFFGLLNGDMENFFGPVITASSTTQTLALPHVDTASASSATLEVALQGVSLQSHQVQVFLNGSATPLGTINFQYHDHTVASLPVSMASLVEGNNTVKLTTASGDVCLLDSLKFTYAHTYQADSDALSFSAQGGQTVSVGGFSSSQIRLIDITDPNSVQEITPSIAQQGSTYTLTFLAGGAGARNFYAFADAQAQQPASILSNQPSTWNSSTNGADFVIISHKDFLQSLQPLVNLRTSQGWSVAVVDIEDVYDEFSYGTHTYQAIKNFLSLAATNWTNHPRFVLFMGKGTYDPRNYNARPFNLDLVPTKLVDATFSEACSDDWLADFDQDGVAEMAVGRLPATTAAEADRMIGKIIGYTPGSVSPKGIFVADSSDGGFTFEQDNRDAAAQLPASISVQYIDRTAVGNDTTTHNQIISSLNQGPLLVNYAGHGNLDVWRSVFTTSDALALNNGNHLPLFILMTCLNGYFTEPNADSIAEGLLKAQNGGAIAIWASSGETIPFGQQVMDKQLYQSMFGNQNLSFGEAAHNAKVATPDIDVRHTWILFGDPTMKFALSPTSATATISGRVSAQDSTPLGGVRVELSGARSAHTITDANGFYQFENLAINSIYTVKPSQANYTFSPEARSISLNHSVTDAAFNATADSVPTGNAIDSADFFVRQHYLDFLDREPDQGGLDYWTTQISQCGADESCIRNRRIDVSAAFFIEQEFQLTGSYVYGLYKAALGRNPHFAEFMPDRGRISVGDGLDESKQALTDEWVTRTEFRTAYPDSMSNTDFVNTLFDTAGLAGYNEERQGYIKLLNSGGSRSQVLRGVVENNAFKAKEYNRAFVLTEYFGYLRRDPDQGGFDFWVNVLENREPGNYRGMVCSFITSEEYQKRFSSVVTHSNSECGRR